MTSTDSGKSRTTSYQIINGDPRHSRMSSLEPSKPEGEKEVGCRAIRFENKEV